MDITRGGGEGNVLQLATRDPVEKVVDWYVEKLKPKKHVEIPGGSAVLEADGVTAVITGSDEGTSIIIKQGFNR